MKNVFVALIFIISGLVFAQDVLDPKKDIRYCGAPLRDEAGRIVRDSTVTYAFRKFHPCPATQLTSGACSGWAIDHIIPMACGGCDAIFNMQWLPVELKSAAGTLPKDRWERGIYEHKEIYDGPACENRIVIK